MTRVCFADDLLLFTKGNINYVRYLLSDFNLFSSNSSLRANQAKSSIYFGGVPGEVSGILIEFNLVKAQLPFKYRSVPLSSKKLSTMPCQAVSLLSSRLCLELIVGPLNCCLMLVDFS